MESYNIDVQEHTFEIGTLAGHYNAPAPTPILFLAVDKVITNICDKIFQVFFVFKG